MNNKYLLTIFLSMFVSITIYSQNKKTLTFRKEEVAPIIDGVINDEVWQKCTPINDFQQHDPIWNTPPTQQTEVRICYTNEGIYVSANLLDNAPDSIKKQLGMRDASLHADHFAIEFDTYNNQQEAFYFQITASGVKSELKRTDASFNAVWKSAVKINNDGWCAEFYIPFSAITFPKKDIQNWRIQFYRYIRRNRELISWCLEEKTNDNDIQFWSYSENLDSIKPPLRLFLTPYLNTIFQKNPQENNNNWSKSFNGGMDLKWGINQSYTLDITLLPDFSQVQSDNQVKNLSAFETVYGDYRPFFYESMSIFQKGDLIYSRRIGKQPTNYYSVYNNLDTNEKVKYNPQNSQLLNAIKFYGRSSNGLAVGVFNAITNKTEAIIENQNNETRAIETEPLTNYNIIAFDKTLKGKSNIFFTNANTFRGSENINANVSALGGNWYFDNGNHKVYFLAGMSRRGYGQFFKSNNIEEGFKYDFQFAKTNGKIKYQANAWIKDKIYNPNDMGLNFVNDVVSTNFNASYNEPNPFGKLLNLYNITNIDIASKITTGKITDMYIYNNFNTTDKKYTTYWSSINIRPISTYDYYEPRQTMRYFKTSEYISVSANFSTDYRNAFAIDMSYQTTLVSRYYGFNNYFSFSPLLRLGNHLNLRYKSSYTNNSGQRGYAAIDSLNNVIFGNRWIQTFENSITAQYVIVNNISLNLRSRYYWSKGVFNNFYFLNNDGSLSNEIAEYQGNKNYNFVYSAFNFDFTFQWDLAPGSSLLFIYKNEIINQIQNADKNYMQYLRYSFNNPQTNTLAIKFLYFVDAGKYYNRIKK